MIGLQRKSNATSLWATGMRKKIGSTSHPILSPFSRSFGMEEDFASFRGSGIHHASILFQKSVLIARKQFQQQNWNKILTRQIHSCAHTAHIALVNSIIPHKWPVETLATKQLSFMRMAGILIPLQLVIPLLQSPSPTHV